ncbi:DUF1444 family protein [Bacillus sp. SL00103]
MNRSFAKNTRKNRRADGYLCSHQDVFIIADVCNESGYDILGQMSMSFFVASGTVPITALSFLYDEVSLNRSLFLLKADQNSSRREF